MRVPLFGALVALWFLWFAIGRWRARQLVIAVVPFAIGAILLVPFLHGYQVILRETYDYSRAIGEIRFYSADVAGLLFASDELFAWGWVHVFQRPESNLFPGLTIVLLTAFAMSRAHPFRVDVAEPHRMRGARLVLTRKFALLLIAPHPSVYRAWHRSRRPAASIARADKPLAARCGASLWRACRRSARRSTAGPSGFSSRGLRHVGLALGRSG